MSKFLNPYNFIRCPPRTPGDKNFGDNRPLGHERLHPNRVSGTVDVRIEARTPLLVPDSEYEADNNHITKKVRVDDKGYPLIPPSSVKGALRSAFEIITNSRMGVPRQKTREDLRHAKNIDQLSAADHVFGWVSDSGRGQKHSSWAGQISIGPVTALDSARVEAEVRTLSELLSPQPRNMKKPWYRDKEAPSSRKVYHHHESQPANEKPKQTKTNQSFTGTVAAGSSFKFRISLRNVSEVHFGALLYLLMLDDGYYLHLGGAKPLGYGSIRLEVAGSQVATNSQWQHSFEELTPITYANNEALHMFRGKFESAVKATHWGDKVLLQFKAAAKPYAEEIHYPDRKGHEPKDLPPLSDSPPVLTSRGGEHGSGNRKQH